MINKLPEVIESYAYGSQVTVSSLIREMKLDKSDFSSLVSKLSSIRLNTSYSPSIFERFSALNREFFIDMFRDADLRMKSYYSTANLVGLMLNSMTDVLFSEIEKVEKDLDVFSTYINNYEFLSGKDDLYNSSYIEKFDTNTNDYRYDGYSFVLSDRDQIPFSDNGNGFIDKKAGIFKIGKGVFFRNVLDYVFDIKVDKNYSNYVTTDSGFYNSLNENKNDSWNVTVKSPVILNSELSSANKYISYDQSYINGAKTLVEITFAFPQIMDSIYITPGHGNGLQLMQVVLFSQKETEGQFVSYDENYVQENSLDFMGTLTPENSASVCLLSSPRLIDSITDINFDVKLVSKIILIFNQPIYSKNEKPVSNTELTARALYETAKMINSSKKQNPDILQDVVYNLFLKNNSIKEIFKNNYFNESYYSFKYPYIKNNFLNKDFRKAFIKEKIEFDSLDKRWSTMLSSIFQNVFIHSIRDKNEYFEDNSYVESSQESRSIYSFNSPGLIPEKNSNNIYESKNQSLNPQAVSRSSNSIIKDLLNTEKLDQYEYSFSIKSIEFALTDLLEQNNKACYVSKKIPLSGHPLAVKCLISEQNNKVNFDVYNFDLKEPISYELSISNVEIPILESDWTPILPVDQEFISSEVLFFDHQSLSASTRFSFIEKTIKIYKDGYALSPDQYIVKQNKIFINELDLNAIYCCSYYTNNRLYNYDNIDFIKSNLLKESALPFSDSFGEGEKFNSTDYLGRVSLTNIPYINTSFASTALYNPSFGTVFDQQYEGYSPVKILMSDGSYAINLTNYTPLPYLPSFPESSGNYFIQNGKEIVFNKIITEPFNIMYSYINNTLRFRIILRKNIANIDYPFGIDSVMIKAKTKNYDPYYDKLNKALTRS